MTHSLAGKKSMEGRARAESLWPHGTLALGHSGAPHGAGLHGKPGGGSGAGEPPPPPPQPPNPPPPPRVIFLPTAPTTFFALPFSPVRGGGNPSVGVPAFVGGGLRFEEIEQWGAKTNSNSKSGIGSLSLSPGATNPESWQPKPGGGSWRPHSRPEGRREARAPRPFHGVEDRGKKERKKTAQSTGERGGEGRRGVAWNAPGGRGSV